MSSKNIKGKHIAITIIAIVMMVGVSFLIEPIMDAIYASEDEYKSQIVSLEEAVETANNDSVMNTQLINNILDTGYLTSSDVVTQYYQIDNQTVGVNTYKEMTVANIAKSGYTPKGIVGYAVGNASSGGQYAHFCIVNRVYLSGNNAIVLLKNANTSYAAKVAVGVFVLYAKNP